MGVWQKIFSLKFFQEPESPQPLSILLRQFWIINKIGEDICHLYRW